jgi:hypothetical protein
MDKCHRVVGPKRRETIRPRASYAETKRSKAAGPHHKKHTHTGEGDETRSKIPWRWAVAGNKARATGATHADAGIFAKRIASASATGAAALLLFSVDPERTFSRLLVPSAPAGRPVLFPAHSVPIDHGGYRPQRQSHCQVRLPPLPLIPFSAAVVFLLLPVPTTAS